MDGLTDEETAELWKLVRRCINALKAVMKPDGFNVGINLGKVAGAGIHEHLHIHIVPRWNGDTNFMPVIAGTGALPDALADIATKLRAELAKVSRPAQPQPMPLTLPQLSRRAFLKRAALFAAAASLAPQSHAGWFGKSRDRHTFAFFSDAHINANPRSIQAGVNMADNLAACARGLAAWPVQPAAVMVNGDLAHHPAGRRIMPRLRG